MTGRRAAVLARRCGVRSRGAGCGGHQWRNSTLAAPRCLRAGPSDTQTVHGTVRHFATRRPSCGHLRPAASLLLSLAFGVRCAGLEKKNAPMTRPRGRGLGAARCREISSKMAAWAAFPSGPCRRAGISANGPFSLARTPGPTSALRPPTARTSNTSPRPEPKRAKLSVCWFGPVLWIEGRCPRSAPCGRPARLAVILTRENSS